MNKNDVLRLRVEAFGSQAEGLCRHEGQVVFVPGALPGEEIDALIVRPKRGYAFGKLITIHEESPEREQPPCPYFPRCGGCSCQHMRYETELQFKRQQVSDLMERVAGARVTVEPVLGMDSPYHYRNKTSMPVALVDGRPEAGFYMRRSHRLVPVERCLIAKPESDLAAQTVLQWMREEGISAYDEEGHSGLLRHIMTRSAQSGELMAVLVINGQELPQAERLVERMRRALPSLVSLCISSNRKPGNAILGDSYEVLWGQERLVDQLCGHAFALSPLSFFQVNAHQAEQLYMQALHLADPQPDDLVFDLYCGAGTLSSLLARHSRQVLGIEIVADAVRDARDNAATNRIDNLRFLEGAAEELLPRLVAQGERPDIVMLDPPRKGAEAAVLEAIAQAGPRRIVYISCHPGSQARDAKLLLSQGYEATACQPVDMFCRTADVENILLFERARP